MMSRVLIWVVRHTPGGQLPLTPLDTAFARPWPTTYRGRSLWLLASVIGLKGVGYITKPSPTADDALTLPTKLLPVSAWGAVFVVVALYAMWTAYCHHGRDRYGYMAVAGLCCGWAGCYAVTPLFFHGPGYAWQGFLSWVITAAFTLYLSRYPDPDIHDITKPRCD